MRIAKKDLKGISPVVAIIQARMGSTRLPAKVMKEICGSPILAHVVSRLKSSKLVDTVVVATTVDPSDDVIERWCDGNSTACFRGSVNDVLDRYCQAAKKLNARTIVRITSDCPLIDPWLVDKVIEKFSSGGYDLVRTDSTYPDGVDVEVFNLSSLEKAGREAYLTSEREHVTPYIWKNPEVFSLLSIKNPVDLSHMRWTVDDEKDFLLVKEIFEGLAKGGKLFYIDDILDFLKRNPALREINSRTMRNEGYAKSLREDKAIGKAV